MILIGFGKLPVAVDEVGRCFFAMTPPAGGKDGSVIWFAGQEVERYDSLDSFLRAIPQYNIDDQSFKGSPASRS